MKNNRKEQVRGVGVVEDVPSETDRERLCSAIKMEQERHHYYLINYSTSPESSPLLGGHGVKRIVLLSFNNICINANSFAWHNSSII
jgi:hypothetical protein